MFQSEGGYEAVEAVLDDSGTRLLTRRESPTEPPNYFIRTGAALKPLTHFTNPMPQTVGSQETAGNLQTRRRRAAFVHAVSAADYKPGTRLPAVLWAYPYEFSDADTAGQVTGHEAQSFTHAQLITSCSCCRDTR